jgi:hypothetical protein
VAGRRRRYRLGDRARQRSAQRPARLSPRHPHPIAVRPAWVGVLDFGGDRLPDVMAPPAAEGPE